MAFATACGGGSTTGNRDLAAGDGDVVALDGIGEDGLLPDDASVTPDDSTKDVSGEPGQPDTPDLGDVPTPDVPDDTLEPEVESPCEDGCIEDTKEDVPPPMCPCNKGMKAWVCGIDDVSYENDVCAACAICMDAPDCPGCGGIEDCNMLDPEGPNGWIIKKAKCEVCLCEPDKECESKLLLTPPCPSLCGVGPDGIPGNEDDETFEGPCEMKEAYDCSEDYDTFIHTYGACKEPLCDPCEGLPKNEVCGADGVTYKNFCTLMNCPGTTTLEYLGACLNLDFCPECESDAKAAVCGKDGVTYANECAAATCPGTEVLYDGPCCVECAGMPVIEVCGEDFNTYPNVCTLVCLLIPKKYDGPCTCDCSMVDEPVCGDDGSTYLNECWMTCEGVGKLYDGECTGDCPQCPKEFIPVCSAGTTTYPSLCVADCLGAESTSVGVCSGCATICGTKDNPSPGFGGEVCGENGITYPTLCFPDKCHFDGILGYTDGPCQ